MESPVRTRLTAVMNDLTDRRECGVAKMKWVNKLCVFLCVVLAQSAVFAAPPVTTLPESRFLHFNDYAKTNNTPDVVWTHDGPFPGSGSPSNRALLAGTNHFHRTGWRFMSCRTGCAAYLGRVPPPVFPVTVPTLPTIASNLAANLRNDLGALIESPVFTNGIGTIYFEAINNLAAYTNQITVEIATNMINVDTEVIIPTVAPPATNNLNYVWETVDVHTLAAATSNDFLRYSRLLNVRAPAKIRIRRTTVNVAANIDSAFAVIDNIRISQPPADVVVYDTEARNQGGNYTLRCSVSNVDTNAPTTSRTLTGYYKWHNLGAMSNVLQNISLALSDAGDGRGNGELYVATLPPELLGGDLTFYVVCDFDGYWYQSPDYTGQGYAGYPSEGRTPFTTATQTVFFAGADLYKLTVNGGSGGGSYTNGQGVTIAASNVFAKVFDRWTGATQYVDNVTSSTATVTMPDFDITLTATYADAYYTLAVDSGSGGGSYTNGQQVTIFASNVVGKVFDRWTGDTQYVASVTASNTVVTMPATHIALTATYVNVYTLTVNSGSGGGSYTNGQHVAITASNLVGKLFDRWVGDTATVSSITSMSTTVTMPASEVALTATYITAYTLTVSSGTGSGSYTNGQQVTIFASNVVGKIFDRWTGDTATVSSVTSMSTTVTMPAASVALTATYLNIYTLTVNSGTGGGSYTNGQAVAITASNVVGMAFNRWTGATQFVDSVTSQTATVTMPATPIALTATYSNIYYTLTVSNGTGGGSYTNGQHVAIAASNLVGKIFDRWTGDTVTVASVTSLNTTVTMSASNIALTATYLNVYTLTVNSGAGGGSYTNGQKVTIAASNLVGKVFDRWTGDTSHVASATASNTVVTMPAADIALTATYISVYTLTVHSGTGSGIYTNGQWVSIAASNFAGKVFERWTGDTANVASVTSPNTIISMPAAHATLTATYADVYTLAVASGSGGGFYTNGQAVAIAASNLVGMAFDRWTGATQYVGDVTSQSTLVTMPPTNIAVSATYSNIYYTLTVNNGTGGGSFTNGQRVQITAVVPVEKTFDRWTGDTAHVASVTAVSTTVTMPAADVTLTALFSSATSVLSDSRFLHFNDYALTNAPNPVWVHEGPLPGSGSPVNRALLAGTNHFHRTGWKLLSCRAGSAAYIGNSVPPKFPAAAPVLPNIASNLAANLRYESGALIESPILTNGIGTIYFEAINNSTPGQITVEIATNMYDVGTEAVVPTVLPPSTNNLDYKWEPISVLDLNAATTNEFTRFSQVLNFRNGIKLRIRRTGELNPSITTPDTAFIVIDNIRISRPPSDVTISKTDVAFAPGYPSVGAAVQLRCYVDNADMNAPTDSRQLKAVYRWRYLNQSVQPWRTNNMAYAQGTGEQGNGERYEASLPVFSEVGDLEYFFICEFAGYVYISPDYTGTGLPGSPANFPYASESLSPRRLRGADDGGQEFYNRLRPYASEYGMLYAETDQITEPVEMMLTGDHEWRAMVPLAGRGLTNLTWRFKAVDEYVPGSNQFSKAATYWAGLDGVAGGRVPYGGVCVETDGRGRLSVGVDSGNYIAITFNTETLRYLATRGEYQNFNAWPAPANFFSESNGQDPKTSYPNNFDAWEANEDTRFFEPINNYNVIPDVYWRDPFTTPQDWVAASAAYVVERPFDKENPIPGVVMRNRALRLKGGDGALGLGYVHNSAATLTDGLKEFRFKCRLGQTASNADVAYHRYGFTNFNYAVRAKAVALVNSMSPDNPSISLVGYYQDKDNFYEYRIVQINDTNDNLVAVYDKRVRHELYQWVNGAANRLASNEVSNLRIDNSTSSMELRFYNVTGSQTLIKCRYADGERLTHTDSVGPVLQYGSFGVLSSECQSGFSAISLFPTDSSANISGTGTETKVLETTEPPFSTQAANWFAPAGRFALNGGVTPKGIYSVVPNQKLGVYVQNTTYVEANNSEPTADWQFLTEVSVNNFSYQSVTVPANTWQAQFVKLQVVGGAADVVVDEMDVYSWHGKESGRGEFNPSEWRATEAWVVSSSVPGLNEGLVPGPFNKTAPNPMTSIQSGARFADTASGWPTNSTYVYSGKIYLSGTAETNTFGEKFSGNVQLKLNGVVVLDNSVTNVPSFGTVVGNGEYVFELRIGVGAVGSGPFEGGLGGYGVAYSQNGGATWLQLDDKVLGVVLDASSNEVQLDHSRARVTEDQEIRSPWLENGLGLLEFDYRVLRAPARLTVQYAPDGDVNNWQDVESFVISNTVGWTHASAYMGLAAPVNGYVRVVNVRSGNTTNAFVEIDNAVLWDEPVLQPNAWRAYNAKITSTDTNRVALDESAGCFLNNSKTADASPPQNEFEPFLESPTLTNGLGKISFYARAYSNSQPATLYLYASSDGWNAPADKWFQIKSFGNITNLLYQLFTFEPEDGRSYDAVKFGTVTGSGTGRVCIEEVAISEPVFPGFDIVNVELLVRNADGSYGDRNQPLEGEDIDVEARLSNIQMEPSNIVVYVSYTVGTNAWGIGNWSPSATVTRRMLQVSGDETLYRTVPEGTEVLGEPDEHIGGILGQDRDQVVQYYVWANYMGGIPLTEQQETFENPSWYYPLDLNVKYAQLGWSPYFFVYGVPLGAVWINEVNATDWVYSNGVEVAGIWNNRYIEIAMPAWVDLAGWKVDLVTTAGYSTRTITIPAGLPAQVALTNGYAFFVIGDNSTPTTPPGVPALPKKDLGYQSLSSYMPSVMPGGLRLRRPQGMYEQTIAYDWDPSAGGAFSGALWAANDPQKKFVYVGKEYFGGSLSVTNEHGASATNWVFPMEWTPGVPNVGQVLPDGDAIVPGFSNVLITSLMTLTKATQNGKRQNLYTLKMRLGSDTNIEYVVDDWYRLVSLTKNTVEQLPPGSELAGTNRFDFLNLQSDLSVVADIRLRSDLAEYENNASVLNWILGFEDGALVPMYYNNQRLSMTEQYWLDADPTASNTFELAVTKFVIDPETNFHVMVRMALNDAKKTSLQGEAVLKLQAKGSLTGETWQLLAQYSLSDASFDANNTCRVFVPNPFNYILFGSDPRRFFFRWEINLRDPRVTVHPLVDAPFPE